MPIISSEEVELLHSTVCQAVTDPKRIRILYALSDQPLNVSALSAALDMPQSTISRHLAILRQRSLVAVEREGTTATYSVVNRTVIEVLEVMRKLLREVVESHSEALEA